MERTEIVETVRKGLEGQEVNLDGNEITALEFLRRWALHHGDGWQGAVGGYAGSGSVTMSLHEGQSTYHFTSSGLVSFTLEQIQKAGGDMNQWQDILEEVARGG